MRTLLALLLFLLIPNVWAGDPIIYKSPNKIDFVKLDDAKKEEKAIGLKHPYSLDPKKVRAILRSIRFNKKAMLSKKIDNQNLFDENHIEFLAPYLIEAFKRVGAEQVVVVSYFTHRSSFMIPEDRLTVLRAYVAEDGLHFKFTKLYAKMLGDRTTQGAARAMKEAKGLRVSLDIQPGQNRISWDPEELVFDLRYNFDGKPLPAKPAQEIHLKMKPAPESKSVRERLKELDRLKEEELITEKEYQKKRKEFIKEL